MVKAPGIGVIDSSKLKNVTPGQQVEIAGKSFVVLTPSQKDYLDRLDRGAQIILPKDGAQILLECGIVSGFRVLEIGAGSGSLTMMLAAAVQPVGQVISYEKNPNSAKTVERNLRKAGFDKVVTVINEDVLSSKPDGDFDAAITDVPEPWQFLDIIEEVLNPGGHFCSYVPNMNQVEQTVKALRDRRFFDIRSFETLQRNIVVGERGTRPDFRMLGHTGYLCFGRYAGDGWAKE